MIPCYKDSRIIQHAETKRQEVLKAKKDNPEQYDYIADDFIVVIKQAEDFKFEITRTIRESITDKKLNVAVREVKDIDWSLCDSEKVNNIRRKVKAVMDDAEDSDPVLNQVVNMYIESYIKGNGNHEVVNGILCSYLRRCSWFGTGLIKASSFKNRDEYK